MACAFGRPSSTSSSVYDNTHALDWLHHGPLAMLDDFLLGNLFVGWADSTTFDRMGHSVESNKGSKK